MLHINLKKLLKYEQHPFHLVKPSPWPFFVGLSVGSLLLILVFLFHKISAIRSDCPFLYYIYRINRYFFTFAVISWFWDIIIEATFEGRHTNAVQRGLRIGFILFLVSEVMFFFALFWAFFYISLNPGVILGCIWPPLGVQVINPWGLPFLNTVILLSSGVSVTWAHNVISSPFNKNKNVVVFLIDVKNWIPKNYQKYYPDELFYPYHARTEVIYALTLTIFYGILFTGIQGYEYCAAAFDITTTIYGTLFYVLTGFHGLHVLIGTCFLIVCLVRHIFYHFTRTHHLGLEFAIWYWHFVDIIWLFLFVCVYVWGSY